MHMIKERSMDHDCITLGWKQRKCLRKPHGMLTICKVEEEANNKIHDVREDDNASMYDSKMDDESHQSPFHQSHENQISQRKS
mmetsp:Transcript_29007/g.43784  ORF Transcript_29007/g.43784 Transcript_29007/m.43784 type:complete len:83 (-) Transcript_29007:631-879(-)